MTGVAVAVVLGLLMPVGYWTRKRRARRIREKWDDYEICRCIDCFGDYPTIKSYLENRKRGKK